ncbi:MAG: hypothetical protein Q4C49_07880 [Bacillota bacterium]|nr:hypothetical protein [Bacillota bacterium]
MRFEDLFRNSAFFQKSDSENFGNGDNFTNPNMEKPILLSKGKMVKLILLEIVIVAILWYISFPAFALNSSGLIFWAIAFGVFFTLLSLGFNKTSILGIRGVLSKQSRTNGLSRVFHYLALVSIVFPLLYVFISPWVCGPILNAKAFANRIQIENVDFSSVKEVDFTKTPIIDRNSTMVLGDRVMGQMPELVSQFEVSDEYTQITYQGTVYRVTPLEYASFIKYLGNRSEGVPAYIMVNSVTGEAKLIKLKDLGLNGMKYVPSGYFNENLNRQLQLQYPTTIFGTPSFEIDEEGHPWYVCTTYDFTGYGTRRRVTGVVLFDPITGESTKYSVDKAPKWVDRIYPEGLVMEEVDNNGLYSNGFLNSIFGQKNVTQTSDGYNYLAQDGDVYIYSGITSATNDSSNLAFVLVNLRTHEAMKISSPGANEYSAMNSAEGEVKNYGYESTFPLLVNVKGNPVYMMALKDASGLIKKYAMVDATNYQKVAVIDPDEGFNTLKKKFLGTEVEEEEDSKSNITKDIVVGRVQILNVDGKSKCFLTDNEGNRYKISVSSNNEDIIAFVKEGDSLSIEYVEDEAVHMIKKISWKVEE